MFADTVALNQELDCLTSLKQLIEEDLSITEQVMKLRQLTLNKMTPELLAQIVTLLQEHMIHVEGLPENCVDIVGTGGDGQNTFNISTTAALLTAACGVPVAKHGNRAMTSKSGGFDCLEKLVITIPNSAESAVQQFQQTGITFLFAQTFHPAFKKFAAARKQLGLEGIKTVFNILGPLLNPAKVNNLVVGVYSAELLPLVAKTLTLLDVERAYVIHCNGYDEANLTGITQYALVNSADIQYGTIAPQEVAMESCEPQTLKGGDAIDNAEITRAILANEIDGPARNTVILNAALALHLVGHAEDLSTAIAIASQALTEGKAMQLLTQLRSVEL